MALGLLDKLASDRSSSTSGLQRSFGAQPLLLRLAEAGGWRDSRLSIVVHARAAPTTPNAPCSSLLIQLWQVYQEKVKTLSRRRSAGYAPTVGAPQVPQASPERTRVLAAGDARSAARARGACLAAWGALHLEA